MDSDLIQQVTSKNQFLYEDVSRKIIGLSFDVMNELGVKSVYHRALETALCSSGFHIPSEVPFEVSFRGINIGYFKADLIVDQKIIVEVKATDHIIGEQAKVQTTRLEHPGYKVPSKIPSCISCSS